MEPGIILGTLGGLVHIIAYVLYNKGIVRGRTIPNNTTWTLWVFLALLNGSSYVKMSRDLVKSIVPLIGTAFRFITYGLIIKKGKWRKLDRIEIIILIIGAAAGLIWYMLKSATYANLILQLAYVISIIPTFRSIWKNNTEEPLPWFLWGVGHSLAIATVCARWSGQYQDLAFSGIGAIIHFIAAYLIFIKKEKKAESATPQM